MLVIIELTAELNLY